MLVEFKKSITKEEIEELPSFVYPGEVVVIEDETKVEAAVQILKQQVCLGFDTETDHALRKLAHFCEFGLLGVELASFAILHIGFKPKAELIAALFCLFTAITDEMLQLLSDRAGRISDVMLDFSGSICGVVVISFIAMLCAKRKN